MRFSVTKYKTGVLYNLRSETFSFRHIQNRHMAPGIIRSSHANLVDAWAICAAIFWKNMLSARSKNPNDRKGECTLRAPV